MTSDVVSVRPGFRRTGGIFLLAVAFFVFKAVVTGSAVDRWVLGCVAAFLLVALVVLCRFNAVTVTPDTVTVRQPLRTVSIGLDRLQSVAMSGRPVLWALTFEGDGTRTAIGMAFVSPADRRRLVSALERRTAPGVVRRDAGLLAMIGAGGAAGGSSTPSSTP